MQVLQPQASGLDREKISSVRFTDFQNFENRTESNFLNHTESIGAVWFIGLTDPMLTSTYDLIVTTMLYGKKTLNLEDGTTTLLSNEIRKMPNQEEKKVHVW